MPEITVKQHFDIAVDCAETPEASGARVALGRLEYLAKVGPSWTNYRQLSNLCCEATKSLTETLSAKRFRAGIFLVGAKFDAERRLRFPNRSLSSPLAKEGLLNSLRTEETFNLPNDVERTAGLYQIDMHQFCDACWFSTQNSWSLIVLSPGNRLWSPEYLAKVYCAAAFDAEGPTLSLNWSALSSAICPLGDAVVVTYGAFDDKERAINFVYDAYNPVMSEAIKAELQRLGSLN